MVAVHAAEFIRSAVTSLQPRLAPVNFVFGEELKVLATEGRLDLGIGRKERPKSFKQHSRGSLTGKLL